MAAQVSQPEHFTIGGLGLGLSSTFDDLFVEGCLPQEFFLRDSFYSLAALSARPFMDRKSSVVFRYIEDLNNSFKMRQQSDVFFVHEASIELTGAIVFLKVAIHSSCETLSELLRAHARDEALHARWFRGLISPELRRSSREEYLKHARASANDFLDVFDGNIPQFIVSTHVAEIRTFEKLTTLRRYVGHLSSGTEDRDALAFFGQVDRVLGRVIDDEKRHVDYTALLIKGYADANPVVGAYLREAFIEYISMN